MNILALEDNRDLQLFYKKILTMWGHTVTACTSLQEARDLLRQGGRPDLMLTDLTLPDASPDSLKDALIGSEFAGIPLVLTSGRDDLESWGRELGAKQVFLKPVDIMKLKSFLAGFSTAAPSPAP